MSDDAAQFDRYCLSCRHCLRGIDSVKCPECGRRFDPSIPATTAARPTRINYESMAYVARGTLWFYGILTMIVVFLSAIGRGELFLFACMFMFLGPIAITLLFIMLVIACWPRVPLRPRHRMLAVVFPTIIVSTVVTNWPFIINFKLHQPALDRLADTIESGAPYKTPWRIGLLPVSEVRVHANGNVGIGLSADSSGGTYLVRIARNQNSGVVWYNTNWEYPMGGGWYFVYED